MTSRACAFLQDSHTIFSHLERSRSSSLKIISTRSLALLLKEFDGSFLESTTTFTWQIEHGQRISRFTASLFVGELDTSGLTVKDGCLGFLGRCEMADILEAWSIVPASGWNSRFLCLSRSSRYSPSANRALSSAWASFCCCSS